MKPVCSIFFHNYYGSHQSWMNDFAKKITFSANLFYNIVQDSIYNIDPPAEDFFSSYAHSPVDQIDKIIVRQASNAGKDIGGKLVLLDAYQRLNMQTDYGLFLHDKKSPYKANNQIWADNLLKIVEASFSHHALKIFSDNPRIGIISATGTIIDEYDQSIQSFRTPNKLVLQELQKKFCINPASFQYVAGTMFWFRMEPVQNFFKTYTPLTIREMLEKGNITDQNAGSYTHSWERLLCWIITMQKYSIKTI
jgi:lipopolysaccharide biosynthesis protein